MTAKNQGWFVYEEMARLIHGSFKRKPYTLTCKLSLFPFFQQLACSSKGVLSLKLPWWRRLDLLFFSRVKKKEKVKYVYLSFPGTPSNV